MIYFFLTFLFFFFCQLNSLYAVIILYVIGSVIFIIAVLGAFGAYKENKCALIVVSVWGERKVKVVFVSEGGTTVHFQAFVQLMYIKMI